MKVVCWSSFHNMTYPKKLRSTCGFLLISLPSITSVVVIAGSAVLFTRSPFVRFKMPVCRQLMFIKTCTKMLSCVTHPFGSANLFVRHSTSALCRRSFFVEGFVPWRLHTLLVLPLYTALFMTCHCPSCPTGLDSEGLLCMSVFCFTSDLSPRLHCKISCIPALFRRPRHSPEPLMRPWT